MTRALILAALLATSTHAQPVPNLDRPPREFQGDTYFQVVVLPPDRLAEVCQDARDLACYIPSRRTVYLWNPCTLPDGGMGDRILCHELGRVNGWQGTDGMNARR